MLKEKLFWLCPDGCTKGIWHMTARGKDSSITDMIDLLTGMKKSSRPIELTLEGRSRCDLIPCMLAFCITNELATTLSNHKVTGWTTYSVDVIDKKGKAIAGISGMRITSKAGPLTPRALKTDIIDFDLKTWDRSDLFFLKDSGVVLATKRVIDLLEEKKVRGAVWNPIVDN